MARPQQRAAYGEPAPDAAELAATLAHGLAKAHAFNDGNKRIAWVVANLFLMANGLDFTFDEQEAIDTMCSLAAGELSEAQMAGWFRVRTSSLS